MFHVINNNKWITIWVKFALGLFFLNYLCWIFKHISIFQQLFKIYFACIKTQFHNEPKYKFFWIPKLNPHFINLNICSYICQWMIFRAEKMLQSKNLWIFTYLLNIFRYLLNIFRNLELSESRACTLN